jgi:hypothetical protein
MYGIRIESVAIGHEAERSALRIKQRSRAAAREAEYLRHASEAAQEGGVEQSRSTPPRGHGVARRARWA